MECVRIGRLRMKCGGGRRPYIAEGLRPVVDVEESLWFGRGRRGEGERNVRDYGEGEEQEGKGRNHPTTEDWACRSSWQRTSQLDEPPTSGRVILPPSLPPPSSEVFPNLLL